MSASRPSESLTTDFGQNSGFVSELYELFLKDPSLVGQTWANYFEKNGNPTIVKDIQVNGHLKNGATGLTSRSSSQSKSESDTSQGSAGSQVKVLGLIQSYRQFGHLQAAINPLSKGIRALPQCSELDFSYHGLSESDISRDFFCSGLCGRTSASLANIIQDLKSSYTSSIGFEYTHLLSPNEREFLRARIEAPLSSRKVEGLDRVRVLQKLIEAEEFENQLHKKYVGQKRFSLQGGETLIPMLDTLLQSSVRLGIKDVVLGMAHRGRLNVLCNTVGKPLSKIFSEFEDQAVYSVLGSGDVKYHKGYESEFVLDENSEQSAISVSLAPNPSHLEAVDPVVEGIVRAKQDRSYDGNRGQVLPVLIHGDAAMAGQGVVFETLNYSQVDGYKTGGTVHIVINNQIGFTTNPEDARSSIYCTDMAKAVEAPIFHVNCEDVDACCWVTHLALEFRQKYARDVVIDLYCFRKYGHNEGDDPSFTQPLAYSEIQSKKSAMQVYAERLIADGVVTEDQFQQMLKRYIDTFQETHKNKPVPIFGEACAIHGRLRVPTPPTGVPLERLRQVAETLVKYPDGFKPHPKLAAILEKRVQTLIDGKGIDWGFAEGLAFGSLVQEGYSVRLSGQDCGRGTFSQRHLALNHYEVPLRYLPFSQLSSAQNKARFEVYNSTLSENAVVGFEFGYAATSPETLVLWEGQFGDFANGAQIIIDQFLAASEAKWDQLSGLVLLLPHGYEGQGPEHSSARLERYLQLAGEGNMVVCYPSNAAQHFHLMRRQGIMEMKRPLIVMTPKSLLRAPEASCEASALTSGQFQTILETDFGTEIQSGQGSAKSKNFKQSVVFCSGKVYYDLVSGLKKAGFSASTGSSRVKIIRVEQLYPFPQFEIKKALRELKVERCFWVQEEPQNMGAWNYIEPYIRGKLELEAEFIGRPVSASPSAGSFKRHTIEQQQIVDTLVSQVLSTKE